MDKSVSISRALLDATRSLQQAGVPEPRREAGSLLTHVLGRDRTFIITHTDESIEEESLILFNNLVQKRSRGEPLQYITGQQHFFGLEFQVTPDVLIPRPETELLVEAALGFLNESGDAQSICDLGTGSGCIAIALLRARANARGVAVDISEPALRIAVINSINHGVRKRINFVVSDGFSSLRKFEQFDLIVSNPPYVSDSDLNGLQREVKNHEPLIALTPGGDGLCVIRKLLNEGPKYLKQDGHMIFEIGYDQGDKVRGMVDKRWWRILDIEADLQGIPRIVVLQKHSR